jgi:hypothetical protein
MLDYFFVWYVVLGWSTTFFIILRQENFVWDTKIQLWVGQLFRQILNTSGQEAFRQTIVKVGEETKKALKSNLDMGGGGAFKYKVECVPTWTNFCYDSWEGEGHIQDSAHGFYVKSTASECEGLNLKKIFETTFICGPLCHANIQDYSKKGRRQLFTNLPKFSCCRTAVGVGQRGLSLRSHGGGGPLPTSGSGEGDVITPTFRGIPGTTGTSVLRGTGGF